MILLYRPIIQPDRKEADLNLETILAKKQTILDSLCSCEAILSLLRPESEPELTGAEMKYRFLYPYRRTITADLPACALLCFDLNVAEVQTSPSAKHSSSSFSPVTNP